MFFFLKKTPKSSTLALSYRLRLTKPLGVLGTVAESVPKNAWGPCRSSFSGILSRNTSIRTSDFQGTEHIHVSLKTLGIMSFFIRQAGY